MVDMTCQELVELVTEFLEGTLDDDTERSFVDNLAKCGGCERYLGQFRHTIQSLRDVPHEKLPDDARATLLDRFRQWTDDGPSSECDGGGEPQPDPQ